MSKNNDLFNDKNCVLIIINLLKHRNNKKFKITEITAIIKYIYNLNDDMNARIIWYIGRMTSEGYLTSYKDEVGFNYHILTDKATNLYNEYYNSISEEDKRYVDKIIFD